MAAPKILQEGQSYTFRSYFELPYEADDILAEFGYSLTNDRLTLPHSEQTSPRLAILQDQIEASLRLVRLSSEIARREILVAPVLIEVARLCEGQLRIEYPLAVNDRLKGTLDYLLRGKQSVLIIEAKKDDLTRGFTQLAIELIALSHIQPQPILYGAVTTGETWRFGKLDVTTQSITQDLTLYQVPDDLAELIAILVGIVTDDRAS